jgi:dUTP pyrophosphatase
MTTLNAIKFELHEGCSDLLPRQAHWGDAGLDLYTAGDVSVGTWIEDAVGRIMTSVKAMRFPHGYWGFIHTRSSTREKWGLEIRTSVIDENYTGPLYFGYRLVDRSRQAFVIPKGTRLGQLVLMQSVLDHMPVERVDSITQPTNGRGANGFGSTGR